MNRKFLFYAAALTVFAGTVFLIAHFGAGLESPDLKSLGGAGSQGPLAFLNLFTHNLTHVPGLLLLQILVIVGAARICGFLAARLGQPPVIGEVAAGILLGPSLLGWMAPAASSALFAPASLPGLQLLAQIGLILFMFVIGMELEPGLLRNRADSAVVISHVSIIFPFALGMGIALVLYRPFAPEFVPFLSFALFMGIAMSITAFPVLARILHDRGLSTTPAGALSLACAAADDVTAWSALAVVIAIARAGDPLSGIGTVVVAGVYVFLMLRFVGPFLRRVGEVYASREALTGRVVTGVFLFVFASALFTQLAGIHALFGAFLAGALMPETGSLRRLMTEKVHDISVYVLLPIFFAFTGLRTEIGLINSLPLWGFTGLIIFAAVLGKFGGSALAGRAVGESWRDSLIIGALMNTRGLMELVVLNIGLELGVISPVIFTMMVLMALATTVMAGPAIDLIERWIPVSPQPFLKSPKIADGPPVLIAYGRPESAETLLRVGAVFAQRRPILALHVTPDTQRSPREIEDFIKRQREELASRAARLGIAHLYIPRAANDITDAILSEAKERGAGLLLVGGAHPIFSSDPLGGRNQEILKRAPCPAGILVEDSLTGLTRVVVVRENHGDGRLIGLLGPGHGAEISHQVYSLDGSGNAGLSNDWQSVPDLTGVKKKDTLVVMDTRTWGRNIRPGTSVLIVQFPETGPAWIPDD